MPVDALGIILVCQTAGHVLSIILSDQLIRILKIEGMLNLISIAMVRTLFVYAVATSEMQIAKVGYGVAMAPSIAVINVRVFGQDVILFD